MNYYQHHIGDFIRDTARLSDTQCITYLRIIWMYYESESPMENDIKALAFRLGSNVENVTQILKHFFFLHDDGFWHHARCDKEILAFREKSKKAKKSANTRWANANAMRTQCERIDSVCERNANEPFFDANQEPITNSISNTDVLLVSESIQRPERNQCPHQKIIDLYHDVLPMCPRVRDWTANRANQLRARWNEDKDRQNLDYWRQLFEYVRSCKFLVGQQHSANQRPFIVDLEWITKSANFTKIREGKYE
jgi:uncharacterized protein YdaU (DUF1376 family)